MLITSSSAIVQARNTFIRADENTNEDKISETFCLRNHFIYSIPVIRDNHMNNVPKMEFFLYVRTNLVELQF